MYQPGSHYFPEHPTTVEKTKEFLSTVRSVTGSDRKVLYCSGPLTTGFIYNNLVKMGKDNTEARKEAFNYNANILTQQASSLRNTLSASLILNPAGVYYDGWKTDDYMYLWTTVISTIVAEVFLVSGWEYSNGTVGEVHCALVHDIPLYEFPKRFNRLTKETIVEKITTALEAMKISGTEFPDISERAVKLETLLHKIKDV